MNISQKHNGIHRMFSMMTEDLGQYALAVDEMFTDGDEANHTLLFSAMAGNRRILHGLNRLANQKLIEDQVCYDQVLHNHSQISGQYREKMLSPAITKKVGAIIQKNFIDRLVDLSRCLLKIRDHYLEVKLCSPQESVDEELRSSLHDFLFDFNECALVCLELENLPEFKTCARYYIEKFKKFKDLFIQEFFRYFIEIAEDWPKIQEREYGWQVDWLEKAPEEVDDSQGLTEKEFTNIFQLGKPSGEEFGKGCEFFEEKAIALATGELPEEEKETVIDHVAGCNVCRELYTIVWLTERTADSAENVDETDKKTEFETSKVIPFSKLKQGISRPIYKFAASIAIFFFMSAGGIGYYRFFNQFDPNFGLVYQMTQSKNTGNVGKSQEGFVYITEGFDKVNNDYRPVIHVNPNKDSWIMVVGIDPMLKKGYKVIYKDRIQEGFKSIQIQDQMIKKPPFQGGLAAYFLISSKIEIPDDMDQAGKLYSYFQAHLLKNDQTDLKQIEKSASLFFPDAKVRIVQFWRPHF